MEIRVSLKYFVNGCRQPLFSIHKAFLRHNLDYFGVIYDKPHNEKVIGTL